MARYTGKIDYTKIGRTSNSEIMDGLKYYIEGTESYIKSDVILFYNPFDDMYWIVKDRIGLDAEINKKVHYDFCSGSYMKGNLIKKKEND